MTIALQTEGLTRRFGARTVVRDLALRVEAGDIYGFLGPNGAGKTTAIRCILGLLRMDAGTVSIFGERHRVRQRQHIGAMVETPAFHGQMSGLDNLRRAAAYAGVDGTTATLRAVLERVGLAGRENDRVRSYSLGMRQRLGIARALLGSPRLLILDEPTNGLDPRGMKEVRDLLANLAQKDGITIFLSSHLLSEVEQLCSRVGIIEKGVLIAEGTPQQLAGQNASTLIDIGCPDLGQLQQVLSGIPGVSIQSEGRAGRLRVALLQGSPAGLNAALVGAGLSIDAFVPQEASLESLFLSLTQQELT